MLLNLKMKTACKQSEFCSTEICSPYFKQFSCTGTSCELTHISVYDAYTMEWTTKDFFFFTSSSGKRIFNYPKHSELLWGSSNLLHHMYHKMFARGQNDCSLNLTTTPPPGAEVKMQGVCKSIPTGTNTPLHLPEGHADIGNVS